MAKDKGLSDVFKDKAEQSPADKAKERIWQEQYKKSHQNKPSAPKAP